jgi:uncharacterized membrane protein
MTMLMAGLVLWYVSHLMKRLAPGIRAALGDGPGKGIVSLLSFLSLYLIVRGFRAADVVVLWHPPAFLTHLNNLLMLVAVFLINLGYSRGVLRTKIRHPMLNAVKTWAIAHLLVNGDLASVILFGGIFVWALVDMILINRQEPAWNRPAPGPVRNDVIYGALSVVLYLAIGWVHTQLGYWPFG